MVDPKIVMADRQDDVCEAEIRGHGQNSRSNRDIVDHGYHIVANRLAIGDILHIQYNKRNGSRMVFSDASD